jgi:ParB family chromosome partitioning protein
MSDTRRVDSIIVGERHRRDLGDIHAVAATIREIGLLQPIVVKPNGKLIAGERRLRAAELLGWEFSAMSNIFDLLGGAMRTRTRGSGFAPADAKARHRRQRPLRKTHGKTSDAPTSPNFWFETTIHNSLRAGAARSLPAAVKRHLEVCDE